MNPTIYTIWLWLTFRHGKSPTINGGTSSNVMPRLFGCHGHDDTGGSWLRFRSASLRKRRRTYSKTMKKPVKVKKSSCFSRIGQRTSNDSNGSKKNKFLCHQNKCMVWVPQNMKHPQFPAKDPPFLDRPRRDARWLSGRWMIRRARRAAEKTVAIPWCQSNSIHQFTLGSHGLFLFIS